MASTEIKLLKFIWENKGKASWLGIIKELRFFSPNYCRLICQSLLKNKFIEFSEDRYKITALGKKELVKLGLIEKVEKVAKPEKVKKPKRPKRKIVAKRLQPTRRPPAKRPPLKETPLTELSGLTPKLIEALKQKGFRTLEDIATTSTSRFMEMIESLKLKKAAEMINEARDKLRKEGKEYLWE